MTLGACRAALLSACKGLLQVHCTNMAAKAQRSTGLDFNLVDQLVFYGSYHTRGWNQAIHFVFVPLIMWSAAVWLAYAPPLPFDLPAHLTFLPPAIARCAHR